jgi:hypothetical protein
MASMEGFERSTEKSMGTGAAETVAWEQIMMRASNKKDLIMLIILFGKVY